MKVAKDFMIYVFYGIMKPTQIVLQKSVYLLFCILCYVQRAKILYASTIFNIFPFNFL